MSVDGRNYTSNLTKLTKHLDKLQGLQQEKPVSPVMIHLSLTNKCNLDCSYCCYGNRKEGENLSLDQAISAIDQFHSLGTRGLELTGGGDPSLSPYLGDVVKFASYRGMKVGLITNGINLRKHEEMYPHLEWMRVSLHGLNYGGVLDDKMGLTITTARAMNPAIDISSVYIWTHGSDETLERVAQFTNKYQLPTRVTPDLTLGKDSIDYMMTSVGEAIQKVGGDYLFLSDFNVKTTRENDACYMHRIKPFVFTDGFVYDCPSIGLSPDNQLNINDRFRVCSIDDIVETYSKPSVSRPQNCAFCKYAPQNEFIHDLKREVKHIDFA